jgi:hypothetical protein
MRSSPTVYEYNMTPTFSAVGAYGAGLEALWQLEAVRPTLVEVAKRSTKRARASPTES